MFVVDVEDPHGTKALTAVAICYNTVFSSD